MRFIVDRYAGRRLAEWLRDGGHDVLDTRNLGPDPGDTALLERAASENRVLITVDKDFGELIHLHGTPHAGGLMRQGHRPKRLRNVMDIKPAETMLISSDGRGRDCSIPEAWAGYRVAEFMVQSGRD